MIKIKGNIKYTGQFKVSQPSFEAPVSDLHWKFNLTPPFRRYMPMNFCYLTSPISVAPGDTVEMYMVMPNTNNKPYGMWFSGPNHRLGWIGSVIETGFTNVTVNGRTGADITTYINEFYQSRVFHITATVATAGTISYFGVDNDADTVSGGGSFRLNDPMFDVRINTASSGNYHWPLTHPEQNSNQLEALQNGPTAVISNYISNWSVEPIVYNNFDPPEKYDYVLYDWSTSSLFNWGVPAPFGNGTAMRNQTNQKYTSERKQQYTNGFTISYSVIFHTLSDRSGSNEGKRSGGVYAISTDASDSKWTLLADDFDGGNPRINFAILNANLYRTPAGRASALNGEVRANTDVVLNTPYHVVGVARPGGTMELFVNGVSQGTSTFNASLFSTWNANKTKIHIGAPIHGFTFSSAESTIDNVRVYDRALSEQEINQLYNADTQ